MRIANSIMLAVFLLSSAVQFNDPDSFLWIFYYGVAAVFAALGIARIYTRWAAVAALAYFAGFAFYIPGWTSDTLMLLTEPKMSTNAVELAREAFGLLICAVWMTVLATIAFKRARNARPQNPAGEAPANSQ